MQKIFKYELQITDRQKLHIPSTRILSVAEQDNKIVVYASVLQDYFLDSEEYEFIIVGTGNKPSIDLDYCHFLGTVKLNEGKLMFHVFYYHIPRIRKD